MGMLGHIQAVARVNEINVPPGARVLSLVGKTIIPGLVDCHAHVERWAIERYLAWGVTTVRDLGAGSTDSGLALRSAVNLGSVLGPRMYTAGAMIDGVPPTYPAATGVATPGEVFEATGLAPVPLRSTRYFNPEAVVVKVFAASASALPAP